MKKTIEYMTTWEAVRMFITDEELKKEYTDCLLNVDLTDDFSIQNFLDNDTVDIQRLTIEQCELLNLEWEDGYYISTWHNEYLMGN